MPTVPELIDRTDIRRKRTDCGTIWVGPEIVARLGLATIRIRPPLRTCWKCGKPRWLKHFPLRTQRERCRFCRRHRPDAPRREVARKVKDARGHWRQAEAARFMGVSLSMYKEWEGGSKPVSEKHWDRIDEMARVTRGERRRGLATEPVQTW